MQQRLADYRVFWREFRQTFKTTGAILPSGRRLARALARYVGHDPVGEQILEVGPGTGAVTREIVAAMGPDDHLDLVELNPRFVQRLEYRLQHEPQLVSVRDRVRIFHHPVEDLPDGQRYHRVISGLPLNNFPVTLVQQIMGKLTSLLEPGGTLSFFEYLGVRPMKSLVSSAAERQRLREVAAYLKQLVDGNEARRDCVVVNVPPAWVHHLQFDGQSLSARQPPEHEDVQPCVSTD